MGGICSPAVTAVQGGKEGGKGEEVLIVGRNRTRRGWEKGCGGQGGQDMGIRGVACPQTNRGRVLAPRKPLRNGLVKDKRF